MHAFLLHRGLGSLVVMLLLLSPPTAANAQAMPGPGSWTVVERQGHSPFPVDTPAPAGSWAVVDERDLAIDGELITLSPDGAWIAGLGVDSQFCVWEVETLEPTCDANDEPIHPDSIRWSPDSAAVAYSLDSHLRLHESDIFVFELAAGQSVNLTDDGYAENIPFGDTEGFDSIPVDVLPAWTPDGQSLVFARSEWVGEQTTTELMTIARGGGEPTVLHTVRDDYRLAVVFPSFPLQDGSILYTVSAPDVDDAGNGVWLLDAAGESTHLMPGSSSDVFPIPYLVDVRESDAGAVASGYSVALRNDFELQDVVAFELDVATGAVAPVEIGPEFEFGSRVSPYRYGPDGVSTIAVEVRELVPHLVIAGPGGASLDLGVHEGIRYLYSRGVDWAENDTILVPNLSAGGILVTVHQINGNDVPPCGCTPPVDGG